ncbi:hypothetical protein ACJRO7_000936 [Eucalyptus globulus]|uniref:Fatty acid desaturase N-terminal domain-containing protein n=1 Tax=Eucalyptus globulus TaxID=34317 RepID=A0ABD3LV08_EUCGL
MLHPTGLPCGSPLSTRVSSPLRVSPIDEKDDGEKRKRNGVICEQGGRGGEEIFDPEATLPFKLADERAAIRKHCWVKDPWRSMTYVLGDIAVVFGLICAAARHGSFSNNSKLNSVVGHLLHSSILVPYNGWRISHKTYHHNHGHIQKDESWHPIRPCLLSERMHKSFGPIARTLRFTVPFPMLAYPLYLRVTLSPNIVILGLLVGLSFIFVIWLDFVTYLHHHGHEDSLPWYRGKVMSFNERRHFPPSFSCGPTIFNGNYWWLNNIHHNIETHVIHYLFPQIPQYHSIEATEAAKPVFGKYYEEPKKLIEMFCQLQNLLERFLQHYVSDIGEVAYYRTDPKLGGGDSSNSDAK